MEEEQVMKFVIQRVNHAEVKVDGEIVGKIGKGFLVLIGVGREDTKEDADWYLKKLLGLRIFEDENGKTNLSLDIFTRIVEVLQISADWLIMADIPQTMEYSSAELSRLLADCSVSESKAILKMAENLKEILRSQK